MGCIIGSVYKIYKMLYVHPYGHNAVENFTMPVFLTEAWWLV